MPRVRRILEDASRMMKHLRDRRTPPLAHRSADGPPFCCWPAAARPPLCPVNAALPPRAPKHLVLIDTSCLYSPCVALPASRKSAHSPSPVKPMPCQSCLFNTHYCMIGANNIFQMCSRTAATYIYLV